MTSQEVAKYLFDQLRTAGCTKAGAAAVLGNVQAESAFIPNNLQDSYNRALGMTDEQYTNAVDNGTYTNFVYDSCGYGLPQWTFWSRKDGFLKYVKSRGKSIGDIYVQVEYLIKELKESFNSIWKRLQKETNLYDLTWVLLDKWENPAVKNISTRYQYAQEWYNKLSDTQVTQTSTQTSTKLTLQQAKEKLLAVARAELGYHEGYNNYIKYAEGSWDNQFYGWELQNQPWCDVYVDYCFTHAFTMQEGAAMTYQTVGRGSALCKTSAAYYKNNNAYYNYPEVGDQIFFYYGGDINHTGIVETVQGSGSSWTSITTIEGNSSDKVSRNTYYKGNSSIAGFGRPKWSVVTSGSSSSSSSSSSSTNTSSSTSNVLKFGMQNSAEVKKLQQNLIKLGYSCGSYGADGDFGYDTLNAVKKFQSEHNINVDGIAGPETLAAIEKALKGNTSTSTSTSSSKKLQVGDKVRIKPGSKYYNSSISIPNFVINDSWIVLSISGDRVVINKNVSGTRAIMSPVNKADVITEATASAPATSTQTSTTIDSGRTYTVKSGDSFWQIAVDQLGNGLRYGEILKLNNMKATTIIHPGDVLKLPSK